MKNIFKKLHIGSNNHDPPSSTSNTNTNTNRSNETSNTSSITSSHRSNETNNTSINNNNTGITSTAMTGTALSGDHRTQDYYSSEEEYQVQLALALSVSGRDSPDIQQIHAPVLRDSPADSLSRQYWVGSCCFPLLVFLNFICILILQHM